MGKKARKQYNLNDVQANILKFHNRRHGVYLFLHFKEGERTAVRDHLAKVVLKFVTSAQQQTESALLYRKYKEDLDAHRKALEANQPSKAPIRPDTKGVVTFGLSYQGYVYLGLPDYVPGQDDGSKSDLEWFKASLGTPPQDLEYRLRWNPSKKDWDPEYRTHSIHAIFILADDDHRRLKTGTRDLKRELGAGIRVLAHQPARRIVWRGHDYDKPQEHFGFRDGISMGPTPADDVLVKEPKLKALEGMEQAETYGSFLAVVKLEQNVKKFHSDAEELAARFRAGGVAADITGVDAESLVVGRLPDGKPRVDKNLPDNQLDVFTYDNDKEGKECPFHSHIRKMNSRGEDPRNGVSRAAQILRRGMSYGADREDLLQDIDQVAPSNGVGLIFTSFQENLVHFVSLFHRAYNPKELDALIGRTRGQEEEVEPQTWVSKGSVVRHLMADFVTPRGGEYFFAPSMHLIRNMEALFPSV